MFKAINKLILSIVSIGLSFSFFKKDPYFRFEKNIDNKKNLFIIDLSRTQEEGYLILILYQIKALFILAFMMFHLIISIMMNI